MQKPYWWYVFYVRTNTEHRVVADMRRYFAFHRFPYEFDPFCPESEYYYRSREQRLLGRSYKRRPLFPGYVFLETNMPETEFLAKMSQYVYTSSDIIRILRYGETSKIALPDEERARLEFLLREKRCLEHSVGYIEGDDVIIDYGPLKGYEGLIVRIDRHNRVATLSLDIFGNKAQAKVALEIVRKSR